MVQRKTLKINTYVQSFLHSHYERGKTRWEKTTSEQFTESRLLCQVAKTLL